MNVFCFRCKGATVVKTKPLIKRLLSTVSVCCRLLSDITLEINDYNKTANPAN